MASIDIKLCTIQGRALTGATLEVPDSTQVLGEVKTPSGTSSQTATAISTAVGQVWDITNGGAAVRLKFGTNPTAVDDATSFLLPANTRRCWIAQAVGEKVAVITSAFS